MKVGTITPSPGGGVPTGKISTLNLGLKFFLREVEPDGSENPPDYAIMATAVGGDTVQIGRAWNRNAQGSNKPYLSLFLEDPSIPENMRSMAAFQVPGADMGVKDVVWSPPKKKTGGQAPPPSSGPNGGSLDDEIPF